jgi:hypothetical protein
MNSITTSLFFGLALSSMLFGQDKEAVANPYLVPLAKLEAFKIEKIPQYKIDVRLRKFGKQADTSYKTDWGSSIKDEYRQREYEINLVGPDVAEGMLEFFFVGRDEATGLSVVYDYQSVSAKPSRLGSPYTATGEVRSGHVKLKAIGEESKDGIKPIGYFAWFRGGEKVIAVAESKPNLCHVLTYNQKDFLAIFKPEE